MAERDRRFGGNLERATIGKQYSRAFPGGPMGVDQRYEDYQAPHRVDYRSPSDPSNRQPGIGEANIRPRGIEQIPSGNFLQRLFHDLRGQAFGPQGVQSSAVDQDDWRTWDKIIKAGENPDDYETADVSDWLDYIPGNPYSKNKIGQLPIDLDPFQGTVGFDKQFNLPFGGTGNIEADYDLNDQEFKTGIMGNWTWG